MKLEDVNFDVDFDDNIYKKAVGESYNNVCVPKKTKGGKAFLITSIILCLFALTLFSFVALTLVSKGGIRGLFANTEEEEEETVITYSQEQVDAMVNVAVQAAKIETKEELTEEFDEALRKNSEEESGILYLLREHFPDNVIFTNGSKYDYFPINFDLKENTINNDNLFYDEESGIMTYSEDAVSVSSHMCIDVSSFQKDIDWQKVKESGVEYVFIRCALRGYGSGKIVDDPYFVQNIEGAVNEGLKVGVYFFTSAINAEEAKEEALYTMNLIAPYNVELPVVIDIEEVNDSSRTDGLTNEEITDVIVSFCETVKAGGYTPMVYTNLRYFIKKIDLERIEDYEKWYALYNDKIYFPYEISVWQYSNTGHIDGISTSVDLNITFKEY